MAYRAPVGEMRFLLDRVLGAGRLAETARFAEATPETVEAVLAEAARLAEDVLAPLRRAGDLEGARLENGVVRTTPGFAQAYRALAEGGWVGIAASPEHGGMGLPVVLLTCVGEMFSGANMAISLCPLLTQGQIEALEHHASAEMKGSTISVCSEVLSSHLAFSAASLSRCSAMRSWRRSMPVSRRNSSMSQSMIRWSKSSPPRKVSPPVARTWKRPSASSRIEMSKVPPPRS